MIIVNWIIDNYEWFFSGIGVVLITGLIALIRRKKKERIPNNSKIFIHQKSNAKGGTQIGIQNNHYSGDDKNE